MKNTALHTIAYCITIIALTLSLSSCGTTVTTKTEPEPTNAELVKANKLAKHGNYQKAAEIYWQVSQTEDSPLKEEYQLKAAELLVTSENYELAKQYLNLINEQNLTFELIPQKTHFRI